MGLDGTWAAYVVVRAACVIPVPATQHDILPGVVSTATDAILTPYHAMKTCCRVQPEHTVLCVGIGGLGHNAVNIAKKCLKARCVIACDVRESALETAREAGADYATTPDKLASVLAEHQIVVDFAFDFVGSQSTFDLCFSSVRFAGTIHNIGLSTPAMNFPPLGIMLMKELTFKTSFYGTKVELVEVLQAVADGLLSPRVEMRPMREVAQVMKDLHDGKLTSRVALIPDNE